ncbi:MAG: hypothetical protein CUN53_16650, partial [Phototrophicales bacterium]
MLPQGNRFKTSKTKTNARAQRREGKNASLGGRQRSFPAGNASTKASVFILMMCFAFSAFRILKRLPWMLPIVTFTASLAIFRRLCVFCGQTRSNNRPL